MISRLRRERVIRDLSLDDVSKETGIALNTISRFERGLQTPNIQDARNLSKFFNVPIKELFENGLTISKRQREANNFENGVILLMSPDETAELLESPIRGNAKETRRIIIQCAKKYKVPIPEWYGLKEK